jgi:hypothetical protein
MGKEAVVCSTHAVVKALEWHNTFLSRRTTQPTREKEEREREMVKVSWSGSATEGDSPARCYFLPRNMLLQGAQHTHTPGCVCGPCSKHNANCSPNALSFRVLRCYYALSVGVKHTHDTHVCVRVCVCVCVYGCFFLLPREVWRKRIFVVGRASNGPVCKPNTPTEATHHCVYPHTSSNHIRENLHSIRASSR